MNGTGIGLWAAHIPVVQARFGLDERLLGWVLLAIAGAAMTAMPLAGAVVGRVGTRRATTVLAFAFTAVMPLPIAAPSIMALFAGAMALGASSGALDVVMNAYASEVEAARGRPTMSSLHGFSQRRRPGGAALGGALIGAGWPMEAVPRSWPPRRRWRCSGPRRLLPGTLAATQAGHFGWPRRAALVLGLLALLCMAVEGAVADWSGLLLTEHTGASPAFAAIGYAAFSIAMAACRFAGDAPSALRRAPGDGGRRPVHCGRARAAAGFPFRLQPRPGLRWWGWSGQCRAGDLRGGRAGTGEISGAGVATAATVGYTGFLLGPPLIGGIASAIGLAAALGLLSLTGFASLAAPGLSMAQRPGDR